MKVVHVMPTEPVSEQTSVNRLTEALGMEKQHANVWTLAEGRSMLKHVHHHQEEFYLVLDGRAQMEVDGTLYQLGERDAICVPPGAVRQMTNIGEDPMTFACVASPPVEGDAEKF